MRVDRGNVGHEVALVFDFILSIGSKSHEIGSAGFALDHVAHCLLIQLVLGEYADNESVVLDKGNQVFLL